MATSARIRQEDPYVFAPYEYETRWVSVGKILIPEYQHPPYPNAVKQLKEKFDQRSYGFITLSEREDESLWVLDGQTRRQVHEELGIPTIKAEIRKNLTIAEEAMVYRFLSMNTSRGMADQFTAMVISNDPIAVTVDKILSQYKLVMARYGHKAIAGQQSIQCAAKLLQIVKADPTGERLESTLSLIFNTWGYSPTAVGKLMVDVVAAFLAKYEGRFQPAWFERKLSECPLPSLRVDAMGLYEAKHHRISMKTAFLTQVVEVYNQGKREGRLEL